MGLGPTKYSSLEEQAEAEESALVAMSKDVAPAEAQPIANGLAAKIAETGCNGSCAGCNCGGE